MAHKSRGPADTGLRERLIDSSIAILSEGRALTLRGAAAHAGVSHAAPAHHFAGLAGLETAVVARAFRDFTRRLEQVAAAQDDLRERMLAVGQTYCDFAFENKALFQLMFVSDRVDHHAPEVAEAQDMAYGVLHGLCTPFQTSPEDAALVETTLWSMMHGYAMLHHRRPDHHTPIPAPPLDQMLGYAIECIGARATLIAGTAPLASRTQKV